MRPGRRSRRCCPGTRSATARSSTAYATAGDPPDVVWRDHDRVRDQYRRSLDYVAAHRRRLRRPPRRAPDRSSSSSATTSRRPSSPDDAVGRDVPVHLIGAARACSRASTAGAGRRAWSRPPTPRSGRWTPSATASSRPSAPRRRRRTCRPRGALRPPAFTAPAERYCLWGEGQQGRGGTTCSAPR